MLIALFISACSVVNRFSPTKFDASDKSVSELITAIELYEKEHGSAPADLEMLVPKYLDRIKKNPSTREINLISSKESDFWELEFILNDGTLIKYESEFGLWSTTLPVPISNPDT